MANKVLIPVTVIDSDESSRSTMKTLLEETNGVKMAGDFSDLMTGYNAVIQTKPSIVIIDISENTELALELVNKISIQLKSCVIFVSAYESSSSTIIKAMRAGAREFITKPYKPEDINLALEKTRTIINMENEDDDSCKVFTVFSNKGGIGKTSIATNLAVSLTEMTNKKVALVDLNLQLGDVTTFLDITPSYDISYIVTHMSRIDESFLLSTMEQYEDKNLYVLADPPYLEQAEEISAEQISTVLGILKSTFSYIIIDTNSSFDSKTLGALDVSDYILLVSMVNLPSIRNSQRCLDLFNRLGYEDEKIKLVVNRYLPNDEIKIEDVEDVLSHPVYWKIPNNYFTVMSAINKGLPVIKIDPEANVTKSYEGLAALLSGNTLYTAEDQPKKTPSKGMLEKVYAFFEKLTRKTS